MRVVFGIGKHYYGQDGSLRYEVK